MVNEDTIRQTLENGAGSAESEAVAAYFGTEQGQKHLSELIDRTLMDMESGAERQAGFVPSEEIYNDVMRTLKRRRRTRKAWLACSLTVSFLVLAGVLAFSGLDMAPGTDEVKTAQLSVPNGEKMHVVFQDGSTAVLNAGSTLTWPSRFGRRSREVILEGEAYFNVETDPKHPFIVRTRDAEVRVYGTAFNLSAYAGDAFVTLALDKGLVEMSVGGNDYRIEPNQVLSFDRRNGEVNLTVGNSSRKSLWTEGVQTFKSASLEEIINSLSRSYDVEFSVSPEIDSTILYTFSSSKRNIDDLLDELMIIAPVRISLNNGVYCITPK